MRGREGGEKNADTERGERESRERKTETKTRGRRHIEKKHRQERGRGRERQRQTEKERKGKSSWEKSRAVLHGKAICSQVALFPRTVLDHMWEVNKAGTGPKNICPRL